MCRSVSFHAKQVWNLDFEGLVVSTLRVVTLVTPPLTHLRNMSIVNFCLCRLMFSVLHTSLKGGVHNLVKGVALFCESQRVTDSCTSFCREG